MKKKTKRIENRTDLVHGPVAGTLVIFSIPFMLSTLLQTLYSTMDTMIVGQFLGSQGLSGVSNGSQVMQMIYMICIGFANAGQVMIAQARGAENQERIQRTVGALLYLNTGISVVIGVLCVWGCGKIVSILGTPEEAAASARAYIAICGGAMICTGLYNLFSAIFRGLGDSRHPLIFVLIASLINMVLDLVFITVFHWGVAGAAWATVIGQAFSVMFSFVFLIHHSHELGFSFTWKDFSVYKKEAKEIIRLGIPMAIQSGAIQVSFLFVSFLFNGLGVAASAAFGVAQKLRNIPGILTQGLGLGCSSMIGQNLGAKRQDRVSKIVKYGILMCSVVYVIFGIVFFVTPDLCFRLFTQDETVLAYAKLCIFTMLLEIPGKCLMPPCSALISAQGFASLSMGIGLLDAFAGRVFLCWLLGTVFAMGAYGYFMGYTMSTYLTAIPAFIYYISGIWKKRALLEKKDS